MNAQRDGRFWALTLVLTFVGAAIRALVLSTRSLAELDPLLPDDTYIAMTFARSFVLGEGPMYEGVASNGFQTLYVLLTAAAGGLLNPDFSTVEGLTSFAILGLAICAVFSVAAVPLAAAHVHRLTRGDLAATALAAFIFAVQPGFMAIGLNGLETSMALTTLLAVWWLTPPDFLNAPTRRRILIGAMLGVAVLVRVDLILLGVYFGVSSLLVLRRGMPASEWLQRNASILAPMAVVLAPWCTYSYAKTGRVIPASGEAVRTYFLEQHADIASMHAHAGAAYVVSLFQNTPWLLLLGAPLLGVYALRRRDGQVEAMPLREMALPLVFAASITVFYVGYMFATHFFPRYLAPVSMIAVITLILAVSSLARSFAEQARNVGAGVTMVVLSALFWVGLPSFQQVSLQTLFTAELSGGYLPVGLWARQNFPKHAVVGSSQSGALAYWTDLKTVNLDGVVSPPAHDALRGNRITQYMLEENVEYLLDWGVAPKVYDRRSAPGSFGCHFEEAQRIADLETWRNAWFVFRRRDCGK